VAFLVSTYQQVSTFGRQYINRNIKRGKSMEETPIVIEKEKVTKSNPLGQWLVNGGPGRKKGVSNRFHLQKQEFFKACKDGKLFAWVQQVLDGKDDRKKLEILRVWASLQPKEVRAEFDTGNKVNIIIVRSDGTPVTPEDKAIDIQPEGKGNA
jgi:hypothetical protein